MAVPLLHKPMILKSFHIKRRWVKDFLFLFLIFRLFRFYIFIMPNFFSFRGLEGLGSIESGFGATLWNFLASSFSCNSGFGMGTKLFASRWINPSYKANVVIVIRRESMFLRNSEVAKTFNVHKATIYRLQDE